MFPNDWTEISLNRLNQYVASPLLKVFVGVLVHASVPLRAACGKPSQLRQWMSRSPGKSGCGSRVPDWSGTSRGPL